MKKCFKFEVLLVCFILLVETVSVSAEPFVYYDMETGEQTEQEIQAEEGEVFPPTKSFVGNATVVGNTSRKIIGENSMLPVYKAFVSDFKYSKICYIKSLWKKGGTTYVRQGTGTMVSLNQVLTAGHCIYDYTRGPADEVYVYPGKYLGTLTYGEAKGINLSYPEDLKKLNYNDSSTYVYRKSDIGVITLNKSVGNDCGYMSVAFVKDSDMMALPSRQVTVTGYPGAGISLGFYDEETNSSTTLEGIMYSSRGYVTRCSGREILYNVDTGTGTDGAALVCTQRGNSDEILAGINVASGSGANTFNIGVHIENTHMKWLQSLGIR